ncbi:MAG: hypothetical protein ACXV8I_07660 [Methylobacter sp.]
MSELQIEANILELDGAYYPVKLHTVPRIGEEIKLFSYIDQVSGHASEKHYEVVQIIHTVRDALKDIPESWIGYHHVDILVKSSQNQEFNLEAWEKLGK